MKVEPGQKVVIVVPDDVHEIILVHDSLIERIRCRAFGNACTLYFFTTLWFVVLTAEGVAKLIWSFD